MMNDTIEMYRDIEYRYLKLFKECALSRMFSRLFSKLDDIVLFRRNIYRVEEPTSKEDILEYLSEFYETTQEIVCHGIKYVVDEECYILYLELDGTTYSVYIEVNNNLISTLWIKEVFNDTFPTKPSEILNAISQEWQNHHWMYIENFLHRFFKFEMYDGTEIFGHHTLSKRQFLVWITSRFKPLRYMKDVKIEVGVKANGVIISINNQSRFILMKITDGKIVEAKEIDTPSIYMIKI